MSLEKQTFSRREKGSKSPGQNIDISREFCGGKKHKFIWVKKWYIFIELSGMKNSIKKNGLRWLENFEKIQERVSHFLRVES